MKPEGSELPLKILLVSTLIAIAASIDPVRDFFTEMAITLSSSDINQVRSYILGFGIWAPIISILMMILQAIIAPLPAFVITFANAAVFGWWQGAMLSWASAMLAAGLCFQISRFFGREAAKKLITEKVFQHVDRFFSRHGQNAILIARFLPFVSFDAVSYGAGLTPISMRSFLIATGIGQLPATLIYSYIGGMLTGGTHLMVTGLMCLFALTTLIICMKAAYHQQESEKYF